MIKVMYNPKWCEDATVEHAIRYTSDNFAELYKLWAELGLETSCTNGKAVL